jgi:hypothetical protein
MGGALMIIILLAIIYVLYGIAMQPVQRRCYRRRQYVPISGLADRLPVIDDTNRIDNTLFWATDFSHPERDPRPDLNDAVITPIKPVSGQNAIEYMAGIHHVSRYGTDYS